MGAITYIATGSPMASLGVGGAALMYMTKFGHALPRVQDDPTPRIVVRGFTHRSAVM